MFGTPVAQRRMIRERSANACAVVRRAVQRVSVALSSLLTMSSAFGRPTIRDPPHQVEVAPPCYIVSPGHDTRTGSSPQRSDLHTLTTYFFRPCGGLMVV